MKKFSVLLTAAALILTAASCSGGETESTTTPAETTTTTAAETTAAPEAETTPEEIEEPVQSEEPVQTEEDTAADEADAENTDDPLAVLKENAPIYADYVEQSMTFPVYNSFAYEADLYGTGTPVQCEMSIAIASLERLAVSTKADGTESTILLKDGTYYIVSPAEKTALYMAMGEAEMEQMRESMTASMVPQFDMEAAAYETGTEEYNGAEYLFEKVTIPEGEIIIYADPATKEIRYIISGGVAMEMTALTHDVDESIFEIPEDYTLTDMSAAQ